MKHLQKSQVDALIAAADTDRNKLLFTLLFQHGLRISECLALTRSSVVRGYLQIKPRKKGKRSDEKLDPATLQLWNEITRTIAPHTMLFPISRQWASVLFHRACERAGIQLQLRQGCHSLRHSLAHAMLDSGAPLPVVQRALRHRSIGSTGVYLQCDATDADRWRARATGQPLPIAPVTALSLADIQAEMARLAELAASMTQAAETAA
jgi:integrase